jgi:hypothetical protein
MELMRRFLPDVRVLLATFWVGSIWAIGYVAAPALFANLGDRMLAGTIAGHLFRAQALVSISIGFILFALLVSSRDMLAARARTSMLLVLLMLSCTLIVYFGLQPMMAAMREAAGPTGVLASESRSRFGALHGIAASLQLLQSLAGAWLVLRVR